MNLEHPDDGIPTLTEIVSPGDDSMKNHFDASCLDDTVDDESPEIPLLEQAISAEDAADDFNISLSVNVDEPDTPVVEAPVLTDPTQAAPNTDINELHHTIELLIDDALKETLPSIEQQLKQQLSETIIKKLSQELDA